MESQHKPWSEQAIDDEQNKFTFAIFSDITGGERAHIFSTAVAQLALLRPTFIMNVGDLTEGGTLNKDHLSKQWQNLQSRVDQASARVFYTGGNHDLANIAQRHIWAARNGPRYYHFVYKNVLFLILDTEDYSEQRLKETYDARVRAMEQVAQQGWGIFDETEYAKMPESKTGEVSSAQSDYLVKVIHDHPNVRWTFLFMHKPVWQRDGEQQFLKVEQALSARDYTVFSGHQHFYQYRQRFNKDYIQLGTTGGVQFPNEALSIDHLSLVTVSNSGVDIANIKMSGIFDKSGHLPNNGGQYCYDARKCTAQ